MNITFLGAAHQVTGSKTLVEWKPDRFFLVDYGLEQGVNRLEQEDIPFSASKIEYVFLTHAHIDHSGLLPLLYKQGFKGVIYSTAETMNLCSIMLADSAHIQETDAASETKKNLRTGGPEVVPLYTSEDAANVMKLFNPCEYSKIYMIDEGLSIRFTDAGHLLGSSFLEFFMEDEGKSVKLVCSGDVGNSNQPIIRDPDPVREADYLLIESTYGTRLHDPNKAPVPILTDILLKTFERGGTVIIPSFAVGRTQELLYFFREIKQNHLLPAKYSGFPVYVDSPLANEATAIFIQCDPVCLDQNTRKIMSSGQNPIWFENLHTVVSSEESKQLNEDSTPKVIIASGGMCEGGRIRHHLKHNLWDARNTILFAGYQAEGTLGRVIFDGADSVKIFGEPIDVRAEIELLPGVSGHADRNGLIRWLEQFEKKPSYVFVNHGDDETCTAFAQTVSDLFSVPSSAPYPGSKYDLLHGEWIRLTEPVQRKPGPQQQETKPTSRKNANTDYLELRRAAEDMLRYVEGLSDHSNNELRTLTKQIRQLITDQD